MFMFLFCSCRSDTQFWLSTVQTNPPWKISWCCLFKTNPNTILSNFSSSLISLSGLTLLTNKSDRFYSQNSNLLRLKKLWEWKRISTLQIHKKWFCSFCFVTELLTLWNAEWMLQLMFLLEIKWLVNWWISQSTEQ